MINLGDRMSGKNELFPTINDGWGAYYNTPEQTAASESAQRFSRLEDFCRKLARKQLGMEIRWSGLAEQLPQLINSVKEEEARKAEKCDEHDLANWWESP
jgi:hypothetical protein